MDALFGSIPQAALDHFANEDNSNKKGKKRVRSDAPQEREGSDDEFLAKVTAQKERKREVSQQQYCTTNYACMHSSTFISVLHRVPFACNSRTGVCSVSRMLYSEVFC
jgi:hypothetical protein